MGLFDFIECAVYDVKAAMGQAKLNRNAKQLTKMCEKNNITMKDVGDVMDCIRDVEKVGFSKAYDIHFGDNEELSENLE